MTSNDEQKNNKQIQKPSFREAGGVHGWLLKKAKTFMWDAASNTFILPKGVVLTKEEREALEEVIGSIKDEAADFEQRRQLQMMAAEKSGVQFKKNIVKGYTLLMGGSYREVTGVLAQKIHSNLQGMLLVNNRFLSSVWKVISGLANTPQDKKKNNTIVMPRGRDGR